jgi:hypothetical protein
LQGRNAISTSLALALGLWNGLLLAAGLAAIIWHRKLFTWIKGGDGRHRNELDRAEGVDAWQAFLAGHPELSDSDIPTDRTRDG